MQQRKNTLVLVILAGVALIVIVLAIAFSSGGSNEEVAPSTQVPPMDTVEVFFPPGVEGTLSASQQVAFDRLRAESRTEPYLRVEQGVTRFSTMAVQISPSSGDSTSDKATSFLNNYADLFGIENTSQNFQIEEVMIDDQSFEHVVFSQSINNIPVYGAKVRVHLNSSGEITLFNGAYIPGSVPPSQPSLSGDQAQSIARESLGDDDAVLISEPMLTYFDEVVFGERQSQPILVWHVELDSIQKGGEWTILINALTGDIVRQYYYLQELTREVWDNHGKPYENTNEATLIMNEIGCLENMDCYEDANNAFDFTGNYAKFLYDLFKRDSFDDHGAKIVSFVNIGNFLVCGGDGKPNAAWNGTAINFSTGYARANDIVAHELTHAIIESEGELLYEKEPGALNESYSDIFAVLYDNDSEKNAWLNQDWKVSDWTIGEDLKVNGLKVPLRDISNPPPKQPDHYEKRRKLGFLEKPDLCKNDYGYVHTNSGIPNKAAYLLIQSGTEVFNKTTVRGIGPGKVARIYYRALTQHLNPTWSFRDARQNTLQSCSELIGWFGITLDDCRQVANAFTAVGIIGSSPPQPSITPTPIPISTSDTATLLVFDSSGSMNEADQSGSSKLQASQAAGKSILEVIKAENLGAETGATMLGMVDFNFNATIDAPLSTNLDEVEIALQYLNADGGTGMPDGLLTALDLFDQDTSDSIPILILLSDGMPNIGHGNDQYLDPGVVRQQVLSQAERAKEMGVCIYTVGFGVPGTIGSVSGESSIDEELLREIANTSGCGTYYNAQNAIQLANVYVELRHVSTGEILLEQVGQISQDQQVDIGSFQLPGNQSLLLYTLNWPGSSLNPILLDPSGIQVDEAYAGASISTSATIASVIVENPRSGQWQVAAYGADVPSGNTTYNAIVSGRQSAVVPVSRFGPGVILVLLALAGGGVAIYAISRKPKDKPPPPVESGLAALVAVSGVSAGTTTNLFEPGVLIGRGSDCSLRISDRSVSRHHARVRFAQGKWYLQDQGSSGGTFVNGINITATALKDGDRVRIGQSEFIFKSAP